MNLFRSEEHARRWSGWSDDTRGGLLPLEGMMTIFSAPFFQQRFNGHYITSIPELRPSFMAVLKQVTGDDPFWRPKA
jgi:hypothetical protein